jgi:hypothetical protein
MVTTNGDEGNRRRGDKSKPLGAFEDWSPTVSCRGNGDNEG